MIVQCSAGKAPAAQAAAPNLILEEKNAIKSSDLCTCAMTYTVSLHTTHIHNKNKNFKDWKESRISGISNNYIVSKKRKLNSGQAANIQCNQLTNGTKN